MSVSVLVNEANSSELELLRQRISELEAKNAKLEAEKAELLKQVMEKDAKRDAENTELKSRVGELEARLAILEQDVTEVNGQPQNDKEVIAVMSCELKLSSGNKQNTILSGFTLPKKIPYNLKV